MFAPGVHGRADAGPAVAGVARGVAVVAPPAPPRLILASASPARRELLARTGLPFEVMPADVDEPTQGFTDPRTMVLAVSWLKAAAVSHRVESGLVLAADTIGWVDGGP